MSDHISKFRLGGPNGPEYTVVLKGGLEPHQETPALYHVTCSQRDRTIDVERTDAVTTRNATVNGIQNDLDRAAFVMFDKVNATSDLRRDAAAKEFTLYHVPTRGVALDVTYTASELAGQTTPDARELSKVLEATDKSGRPVVWSVHSRGALVFDMAARDCARRGVQLQHESVAVYNGAANEQVMSQDLRDAGIAKLGRGYFNHPGDPVPQLVGDNTINPVKRSIALYNSYGVMTSEQSIHTWHAPLTEKDYASVSRAQWEQPGIDQRPPLNSTNARAGAAQSSPAHPLDATALRKAHLPETDPTFRLVSDAVAARDTYAQGTANERTALLASCSRRFRQELSGPDRTGVPLRSAALGFVEGSVAADTLLELARKHSNAIQNEQSRSMPKLIPDLGLGR